MKKYKNNKVLTENAHKAYAALLVNIITFNEFYVKFKKIITIPIFLYYIYVLHLKILSSDWLKVHGYSS